MIKDDVISCISVYFHELVQVLVYKVYEIKVQESCRSAVARIGFSLTYNV